MTIRNAETADAASIAALLPDLGYPATENEVGRRLAALGNQLDHAVFVAVADEEIFGLCQVQGVRLIASDGYAEVYALVVSEPRRRGGIGTALLTRAVEWAEAGGYHRVRLRSGVHRENAHRFYEAAGFIRAKASFAFEKGW